MSLKSIRSLWTVIAPFCLVLFLALITEAQVQKKVMFAKGKNSATYTGKLPRNYADYDSYFFRARKGQTITVKLTCADRNASFAIYETKELGPDEDLIVPQNEMNRLYTGKLPITSEYSVQVYDASENDINRAAYTIEISLR